MTSSKIRTGGRRLKVGDRVTDRDLQTIYGRTIRLIDPERLTHLQFRRFAGCPACNLHLRSIVTAHPEIARAGVRELVLFHSDAAELRLHVGNFPFDVVGDPQKRLYAEFGIEPSIWALLHPRAYLPMVRGIAHDAWAALRGGKPIMRFNQEHGFLGVPADLLIAPGGEVLAVKYGTYNFDQWSVADLLAEVRAARHSPDAPAHASALTAPLPRPA